MSDKEEKRRDLIKSALCMADCRPQGEDWPSDPPRIAHHERHGKGRKKLERKGKKAACCLETLRRASAVRTCEEETVTARSGRNLNRKSEEGLWKWIGVERDHVRRAAEIRGTKSASVKVGLPRAVSLCDITASGSSVSSSLGQVRSSASLPSLLNTTVYISSPVTSSRINRVDTAGAGGVLCGKRSKKSDRRCYPATEREPLAEEVKAAEAFTSEFPSSGLNKLSHFLRELARQDCWAGLFEPFQGTGHFNSGNFSHQDWKLRQTSTSTANMTTTTDSQFTAVEGGELSTPGSAEASLCLPETQIHHATKASRSSPVAEEGVNGSLNGSSARVNGSSQRIHENPQAELCHQSASCVTAEEIGSCENLARWLEERIGSSVLSQWGSASATKRVANLWCELVEGEISLEDSRPPKRTAHVASVKIRNEQGHVLVEAYQQMADGRVRPRNRPLSEKMRPGEHVEEACLRGIYEELGCQMGARERVVIIPESYRREEEERESFSYPGLPTRYVIHTMVALVDQLPSTEFSTEEDESGHGTSSLPSSGEFMGDGGHRSSSDASPVGVKRHFWKWVPENELAKVCRR
ncbi:hypothetical protein R1flu_009291 [Riccia fluitans]|uniref:Nudix hydrolase domain-containing protein n=1 Tax=Riccia fluitans TaxID=41844 RepID=A0ABD1Z466_9MARC